MSRDERIDALVKLASKLDKMGLHRLAGQVDEVLNAQSGVISDILTMYEDLHTVTKTASLGDRLIQAVLRSSTRPDTAHCPFGLPIPMACKYAGDSVQNMSDRKVEHKNNRRVYNKERGHCKCPYALQILGKQDAVRCSYGTINAKVPHWKQYRGSPYYPKLWQGFNIPDVVLDSNYYNYNDFGYYSLY